MENETNQKVPGRPELALTSYLDSLLKQVDEAHIIEENLFPADESIQDYLNQSTDDLVEIAADITEVPEQSVESQVEDSTDSREIELDHPTEPFQALAFIVDGVRFAVKLTDLKRIIPCESPVTTLPGQASWMLGTLQDGERTIRVINTQKILMPERVRKIDTEAINGGYQRVLLFGEGENALACDEIGSVMKLEADDVHWQSKSGNRRWLAGTVVDSMCALLNLDALIAQL